jgi:hypothetical protein
MKKLFHSLWIPLACIGVIILTSVLIMVFYITVAVRKIFIKDFTPNAARNLEPDEDEVIGSARSHLNAIQATLDKTKTQSG